MHEFYINKPSVVHQIDARVKLIFTLGFIISVGLLPEEAWAAYILNLYLILSISLASHVGYGLVLKRSLLALPFILAAAPLIYTGPLPHIPIVVGEDVMIHLSPTGSIRFLAITAKSWLCIQAAVLLVATTQFTEIVTAMKQMQVPAVFTSIIDLMWRYLFVIVEEAQRLMRARLSRSSDADHATHTLRFIFWQARVTGGMAGSLFLRSLERSDRVYAAMLSRGYSGELLPYERVPLSKKNWKILGGGLCTVMLILMIGLLVGG